MGLIARALTGLAERRDTRPRNETAGKLDALIRGAASSIWAGIDVNYDSAIQVSAVFACVRVISEDIGKLPVIVYEESGGEKQRDPDSHWWRLLHDRPNGWQSSQQFRELMTFRAALLGDAVALPTIVNDQVRELLPVRPDRVRIEQEDDWEITYLIRDRQNAEKRYSRKQVFHLTGPQVDDVKGAHIVRLARQAIGLALAAERHAAVQFGNGARPGAVLSFEEDLEDDEVERLKESLDQWYARENAGKTLVLEKSGKWAPAGQTNEQAQLLPTREHQIKEACRWFRVPPIKVQEYGRATWGNATEMDLGYVKDTLLAWGVRWDNAFNHQVINAGRSGAAIAGKRYCAETLFDAQLRGSTLERFKAYEIAIRSRVLKPNEARRFENLPPYEGGNAFPPVAGAGANANDDDKDTDDARPPRQPDAD